MSEMSSKVVQLRDALKAAVAANTVAMIAAEELADALEAIAGAETAAPATDAERRQVAALRKLMGQPGVDGVAMTHGQVEHEIAYWTAEAERRPATPEQTRQLAELAAALTLDGIKVHDIPDRLSLAGWVRELRFLKSLRAEQPAGSGK